jgi:hypothetical protein
MGARYMRCESSRMIQLYNAPEKHKQSRRHIRVGSVVSLDGTTLATVSHMNGPLIDLQFSRPNWPFPVQLGTHHVDAVQVIDNSPSYLVREYEEAPF